MNMERLLKRMNENNLRTFLLYVMQKKMKRTSRLVSLCRMQFSRQVLVNGEEVEALKAFLAAQGVEDPQRQDTLLIEAKNAALNGRDPDAMTGASGLLLAGVFGVVLLMMAMYAASIGALLVILPMLVLFFVGVFTLVWAPRRRAMDGAWNSGLPVETCLEQVWDIQTASLFEVLRQCPLQQTLAFVVAVVITAVLVAIPTMQQGSENEVDSAYQKAMESLAVSADNAGTRYVVWLQGEGAYTDRYLAEDKRAQTAQDVAAVLHIVPGEEVVGRYEDGGNACRRYVTVVLQDMRTGEYYGTTTVYGGDPPSKVVVRNNGVAVGYGDPPLDSNIEAACAELIAGFESKRTFADIPVPAAGTAAYYVAYLVDEDVYTHDYIPRGKWALTAEEVVAVLRITRGAEMVSQYNYIGQTGQGNAGEGYRRFVTIDLVDMRTGTVVLTQTVYGGDPPRLLFADDNGVGYGEPPTDEEIRQVCTSMINAFDALIRK